jgi:hypothetical protein
MAKQKSVHDLKQDKDHILHPKHYSPSHMRNMANEKVGPAEGSAAEEASESPATEASEVAQGID